MNQRTFIVLKYLLHYKYDLIDLFVKNMNRKAISECLIRILTSNTDDIKEGSNFKIDIIDKILTSVSETNAEHNENHENNENDEEDSIETVEKIENISLLLLECLSNKKFYTLFMTNINLLKKLNCVVFSHLKDESCAKETIKILIKINENIIKDFGSQAVTPSFNQEFANFAFDFKMFSTEDNSNNQKATDNFDLQGHLEAIIEILSEGAVNIANEFVSNPNKQHENEISTTFERKRTILGSKKLLEFEYLKTFVDILINGYANDLYTDKIINNFENLIRSNFFKIAIEHFYTHEFNNIFQKLFEQLFILACNKHSPEILVKHIFGGEDQHEGLIHSPCDFLASIILHCDSDENLKFQFK